MIDPATARTIAARQTQAEIEALQDDAIAVASGAAEVSKSFGGGSITVSRDNVSWWLANLEEALRLKAAGSDDVAEVSREPYSSSVSYANRLIQ